MRLSLPEGYRVVETTQLRLFDPQGQLVQEEPQGPDAVAALEKRAWHDAFERVGSELEEELQTLREGTRPLHELRRLRQYMSLLEAVDRAPVDASERPGRQRLLVGLAVAAACAVVVAGALFAPMRLARNPEVPKPDVSIAPPVAAGPQRSPAAPAVTTVRKRPQAQAGTPIPAGKPHVGVTRRARAAAAARLREETGLMGYVVSVGEFASQTTAETKMHFIRSKGYVVYVWRLGDSFHVVTRPYARREQAERLAKALQEIGLPAKERLAMRSSLL